jgi:hypothetical protein
MNACPRCSDELRVPCLWLHKNNELPGCNTCRDSALGNVPIAIPHKHVQREDRLFSFLFPTGERIETVNA